MYTLYFVTENLQISTLEVETMNDEITIPENLLFIAMRKGINFINEPSECLPFFDIERLAIAEKLDDLSLFHNHSFRLKNSKFTPLCPIDPLKKWISVQFQINTPPNQNDFFIPYSIVNLDDDHQLFFTRQGSSASYASHNSHKLPLDTEYFKFFFDSPIPFTFEYEIQQDFNELISGFSDSVSFAHTFSQMSFDNGTSILIKNIQRIEYNLDLTYIENDSGGNFNNFSTIEAYKDYLTHYVTGAENTSVEISNLYFNPQTFRLVCLVQNLQRLFVGADTVKSLRTSPASTILLNTRE